VTPDILHNYKLRQNCLPFRRFCAISRALAQISVSL
jgi:hypothetical protein